jgi:hypothetical protein
VLFQNYPMSDQRMKFVVQSSGARRTVYSDVGVDVYPCFQEVYWTPDSRAVAIFAVNCWGPVVTACHDVVAGRNIECARLLEGLRSVVASKYQLLSPDGKSFPADPLAWAASEAGRAAYSRRQASIPSDERTRLKPMAHD